MPHDDKFLTPLAEGAAQLHELYEAWRGAGFSEAQSMELVKTFTAEAVRIWMEAGGGATATS